MQVRCIRSFVGTDADGNHVSYGQGDIFELPARVDWLQAGLVEPVVMMKIDKAEKAIIQPKEKRVRRMK